MYVASWKIYVATQKSDPLRGFVPFEELLKQTAKIMLLLYFQIGFSLGLLSLSAPQAVRIDFMS